MTLLSRIALLWFAWTSGLMAIICLIRLGFDEWPVVLKYSRWEYIAKVVLNAAASVALFWLVYR